MRTHPFLGLSLMLIMGMWSAMTYSSDTIIICISFALTFWAFTWRLQGDVWLTIFMITTFLIGHWLFLDLQQRTTFQDEKLEHILHTRQWVQLVKFKESKKSIRWTAIGRNESLKVFIYQPTSNHQDLRIDDIVMIDHLDTIVQSRDPFEFNFHDWAKTQGVKFIYRMVEDEVLPQKNIKKKSINRLASELAARIQVQIDRCFSSITTRSLIKGMLLGKKESIENNTISVFQKTGTMHIMAVSGLHVGIIAGILMFLVSSSNLKTWRWLRFFLTVGGVWTFVLITGAKTSAIRAAMMFTILQFGWSLGRDSNAINNLSLGIFILMISNPLAIMDIGFQLSASAVLSILIFYPIIDPLFKPTSQTGKLIWPLICMSISVQFLLAPIIMFYFHQFPIYFILNNLIAIPLVTLVLIIAIIALFIYSISPPLGKIMGDLTQSMADLGIHLLELSLRLPFSVIDDIWIKKENLFILLTCILLAGLSYSLKSSILHLYIITIGIVCILHVTEKRFRTQGNEIVIYDGYRKGRVDFFLQNQMISIGKNNKQKTGIMSYKDIHEGERFQLSPLSEIDIQKDSICIQVRKTSIQIHRKNYIRNIQLDSIHSFQLIKI